MKADPQRVMQDIDMLATFHDAQQGPWTRTVFSPHARQARAWLEGRMEDAGLTTTWDAAGNLSGTLPGRDPNLPPVVMGSHTDTVPQGGRFDGILGVLGGLEAIRLLAGQGTLARDVVLVDFLGEEANEFGLSCLGSRAMVGRIEQAHLDLTSTEGTTLRERWEEAGADPAALPGQPTLPRQPHAFLELHIEQGPVLDTQRIDVGIVTAIAGIRRAEIVLEGRAGHAGATPMEGRHDALPAAAEAVLAVERIGQRGGGVATCGSVTANPPLSSVISGQAKITCEFRSESEDWLTASDEQLRHAVAEIARARDLVATVDLKGSTEPATADPKLMNLIQQTAETLNLSTLRMFSGAGHDALHLSSIAPMGMIFVPCREGLSHVPDEWAEPSAIANGVNVLAQVVKDLCTRDEAA